MLAGKRIVLVPLWLLVSLLVHMYLQLVQLHRFVLGFGDEEF